MSTKRKWWVWALGIIGVAALLALVWSLLPVADWTRTAMQQISDWGPWGMVAFVVLYVILASFTFPSTPLNISAGVLFSYPIGYALAMAGSVTASMVTFLISRYAARDWVKKRVSRIKNADEILETIADEGFKAVLLARLNPFIPASLKNYGFGITSMSTRKYVAGTVLGQMPIVAAHVYLGWAGGAAMMSEDADFSTVDYALIGLGVLSSIVILILISWYGKRRLAS